MSASSTNAPRQIDVDLTISLTNSIRDHGAGIELCSIFSIAVTSSRPSRWMSNPRVVLMPPPFPPSNRLLQGRDESPARAARLVRAPPMASNRLSLGSCGGLLGVGEADVDRLDEVSVARRGREQGVEARAGDVDEVVVGRDLRPGGLELRPVADGAVAD